MNHTILFGTLVVLASSPLQVKAEPASVPTRNEVASRVAAIFSGMHSFEYMFERNSDGDPYYSRLIWKEMGPSYWYHFITKSGRRVETDSVCGFDGNIGYRYFQGPKQVQIAKRSLREREIDRESFYPFMVFDFLCTEMKRVALSDIAGCAPLLEDRIVQIEKRNGYGRDCIVCAIVGGYDRSLGIKADYEVWFSIHQQYFPIALKWRDKEGEIGSIEVLELTEYPLRNSQHPARSVLLATKLKCWQGRVGGKISVDVSRLPSWLTPAMRNTISKMKWPGCELIITFDKMAVDTCNEGSFAFDPGTAETIHDLDANKLIRIPK